jgi:nickel/cobalt transporter (NiCoT) family protein
MSSHFGLSTLSRVFQQSSSATRKRIVTLYTFLIAYNIVAWVLAFVVFKGNPGLLLLCLTAYEFGLRHAFDADHISAIDNVTRKLMQDGKRPVGVGFFFSLGHSTIVVALTIVIAATALALRNFNGLEAFGGIVGTLVSSLFLMIIAAINIIVFVDIYKTFQEVKKGGAYNDFTLNEALNKRGLMARFFRPLLAITNDSWNMYPVGVLFGLGFDTATEVGLLAIAASTASKGVPIWAILIFPALFTAGMSLMDTTDGILMLGAYGWAFVKPIRKLFYNMNITLVSVIIALFVGGLEALGLIASELNLSGPFWDQVNFLNGEQIFNTLGFGIVGIFLVSWLISTIIYKVKRYDDIQFNVAEPVFSEIGPGGEIIAGKPGDPGEPPPTPGFVERAGL